MIAVIDCGTTSTRVYIIDDNMEIVSEGYRRVGVRNTSMTGSKETLRNGVKEAIIEATQKANMLVEDLDFAVASGMITSEIGLIEIPHLITPIGQEELVKNLTLTNGMDVVGLPVKIVFIPGIRNDYGENATLHDIRNVDFMRGEETQIVGIWDEFGDNDSINVIVLSSHTKLIHINKKGQVEASLTTISGQLYEAILKETMIGKSLTEESNEESGGYGFEEVADIAYSVQKEVGLDRCLMIPRFMQVLLKTDYKERNLFLDSAIAADNMSLIAEFIRQGYKADKYILFGHKARCEIYSYLIIKTFGDHLNVISISDKDKLSQLTVRGAINIIKKYQNIGR